VDGWLGAWKLVRGAYVAMICWVLRGYINSIFVAIHFTWVAYSRIHYISCDVQSARPCCLKASMNYLAF
jgi:hypothetical protein